MEGKEVQTEKANNKPLVILLISLLTLIVVIVGVIIIVLNNKNSQPNNQENLAIECLDGDSELLNDCLDDKAFEYFEEGDCVKALKVYDDVPVDRVDQDTLEYLYDEAYSMSISCEDETLEEYWRKKNDQFNNKTEARS